MKFTDLSRKRIPRIGVVESQWLTFLAREFPRCEFAGLDCSESGCLESRKRAVVEQVNRLIERAELFGPPEEKLKNQFNVVITCGVVNDFDSLDEILPALLQNLRLDQRPTHQKAGLSIGACSHSRFNVLKKEQT